MPKRGLLLLSLLLKKKKFLGGGGGGRGGGAVVCINMNLPLSKDDGKIGTLVHSSGLFFVVVFVGVGLPCLSQ